MGEACNTALPAVALLGLGAITPLGRDLTLVSQTLREAPTAPSDTSPLAVDDAILRDPAISKSLRRADRYIRMASLAAMDAWTQAKPLMGEVSMDQVGMILASGLGPHPRGFKFLDGILDHGDAAALPTDFSHSVHGAAGAYIAGLLDLRGPTFSLTDFHAGLAHAFTLAQCWIDQSLCQYVLVGACEELGAVLQDVSGHLPGVDALHRPSEGSVFFLVGRPRQARSEVLIDATDHPALVDLLAAEAWPLGDSVISELSEAKQRVSYLPTLGVHASLLVSQMLGSVLAMQADASIRTAMAGVSLPQRRWARLSIHRGL